MLRIGIIIDNKKRDLAPLINLTIELLKKDNIVYLIPLNLATTEIKFLNINHLVINYARAYLDSTIDYARKYGATISVLDTEGSVESSDQHVINKFDSNVLEKMTSCDNYFFWGEKIASLAKNSIMPARINTHITGSPKTDLLSFKFKKFRQHFVSSDEKYILFSFRYPLIDPKFSSYAAELESYCFHTKAKKADAEVFFKQLSTEKNEMIQLVRETATKFSNTKIVLRLHPFEDIKEQDLQSLNLPNIEIDNKNDISIALENAICLVHRGCSTSVEARIMNIYAITPDWTPFSLNTNIDSCSNFIKDKSDFFSFIEKLIHNKNKLCQYDLSLEGLIRNYFTSSEGNNAKLIAKYIVHSESKYIMLRNLIIPLKIFHNSVKMTKADKKNSNDRAMKWDQSAKFYNDIEVQKYLDVFSKTLKKNQVKATGLSKLRKKSFLRSVQISNV